jgi:hypothetical protein
MPTPRKVPQDILNHPGFVSIVRADPTGFYTQHSELVYETLLAMCQTPEGLRTYLNAIANDDVQTIGNVGVTCYLCVLRA